MKKTVLFVATMLAAAGAVQQAAAAVATIGWTGSTPPDLSNVVVNATKSEITSDFHAVAVNGGTGTAENVSVDVTATNPSPTANQDKQIFGVYVSGASRADFGGETFDLDVSTNFVGSGNNQVSGLTVEGGTNTLSADVSNISVESTLAGNGKSVYGIAVGNSATATLALTGREVNIDVKSATVRPQANKYSEIAGIDLWQGHLTSSAGTTVKIVGSTSAEDASVATDSKGNNFYGTSVLTGIKFEGGKGDFAGDVEMDLDAVGGRVEGIKITNFFYNTSLGDQWGNSAGSFNNLKIDVASQTGDAFGVASTYNPNEAEDYDVVLNVTGDATIEASSKSGKAYGIYLNGKAAATFSGNLTVTAAGPEAQSGAAEQNAYSIYVSDAVLVLNGPSVTLNGDVKVNSGSLQFGGTTAVTNRLSRASVMPFADGTPTNVTIYGDVTAESGAGLSLQNTNLTVVDGELDADTVSSAGASSLYLSGTSSASISTLNSTGETVVKFDSTDNKATINSVTGTGGSITAEGSSVFNEQYGSAAEAAEAAASVVTNSSGQVLAKKVVIDESESNGGYEAALDENGDIDESTVVETLNTKTKRVGQTLSQNILAWRLEMNDLNKRLGELRDSEGNTGLWARVNAGTQRYKGSDNDFVMLQVGADTKVPAIWNTHVGAAFSYTKADLSYTGGDGDNEIYGLAGYASWLGDSGSFLDVIAKVAYLDSDSKIDGTQAKFDTMAYSLSAEIGHRFDVTNVVFVEPQMELSYGYVKGKTFDTKSATGIRTETTIDGTDSLIGRMGFRAGLTSPEKKGNVYVRASVLREFQGDFTMTRGDGTYSVETKDTWFEYGVGGNYNISPTTQIYADVERNTGADLSEPWRFNVGARWAF